MPTLLTACTQGTGHVTCTPREGRNTSREARKQALGTLPMSNGSQHGEAPPCESANACIYNVCHPAPVDERPPCAETFCGILSQRNFARPQVNTFKRLYKHTSPPASPLSLVL